MIKCLDEEKCIMIYKLRGLCPLSVGLLTHGEIEHNDMDVSGRAYSLYDR